MNYELLEKVINFCFITDFESRRKVIRDSIFMGKEIIVELHNLINDTDDEDEKLNYHDHMEFLIFISAKWRCRIRLFCFT